VFGYELDAFFFTLLAANHDVLWRQLKLKVLPALRDSLFISVFFCPNLELNLRKTIIVLQILVCVFSLIQFDKLNSL
jgi:hypothetical protein